MSILNHFFDYKPEVLALDEKELPHLQHLFENGTANGVPGMKILSREETLAMEPNLSEKVCGALWAPSAAIVNPWEYALAMTEVAVRNGVELRRSCKVTDAKAIEGGYRLTVPGGTVETRCVINAAGIWADKVHSMVEPANFRIIPTRGEYYLLDKSEGTRVSHVIFQCPNALGKGVLVAPTVHGNLLVGPNAEPVEGNDTSCTSSGLEFVKTTAQRSVPSINFGKSIRNFAGVRANLDVDDFIIGEEPEAPGWIDLAGMKSPGLSAAPAVAEEAVAILQQRGVLGAEKSDYKDGRRHIRFKELSAEEKKEYTAQMTANLEDLNAENEIETLIKAKGFADCLCFLQSGRADLTVMTSGEPLTAAQVAQIRDVVLNKSTVTAQNITVVEVK